METGGDSELVARIMARILTLKHEQQELITTVLLNHPDVRAYAGAIEELEKLLEPAQSEPV